MLELNFSLQPKQLELWNLWDNSDFTRIGYGGARGGAKSGGIRRCMLLRRLKYPRTTGLIIRRTIKELEQSHLIQLFNEFPQCIPWYKDQKKQLQLPNGSVLFFGSAQNEKEMADFCSAEFADIAPDEGQEFSQREIERLSGSNRCTTNRDITPKMIIGFMPSISESGVPPIGLTYLRRVFVEEDYKPEERRQKWAFVQAHSWDNIEWSRNELVRDGISDRQYYQEWNNEDRKNYFLTRTDYGAQLLAITDPHLRDAWLYGKWDVFQGQYFPQFDPAKHVITVEQAKGQIKPWHTKWMSGDWGYDHPHSVYWHAQDENGKVTTYREQWGRQVGEIQLGQQLTAKSAGEKLIAFPFSWDAGKQSKRSPRDYPKSIVQMLTDALGTDMPRPFPADSSPGSRIAGWRLMAQLLDSGMWQITEDCPRLIECIPSLLRDGDNTEDVRKTDWSENNIGDDPADSARMGLQFMLGSARKPAEETMRERALQIDDPIARWLFVHKEHHRIQAAAQPKKDNVVPGWMTRS